MKINEQIKNHRKDLGLTQEQVAAHLGVSTPAVNKWEKGSTYPDITLLPALARLLKIDMNELFSFREELTRIEVGQFVREVTKYALEENIDVAFEMVTAKIQEYPHCDELLYMSAITLEGALILSDVSEDTKKEYENKIFNWMEKVSDCTDEKIRYSVIYWLAAKYLNQQDYEKASYYLGRLPDVQIDKTLLQARVMLHEKDRDSAAIFLEGNLLQTVSKVQSYLYKLLEIEEEAGNHWAADGIADVADKMCVLFGLWNYGTVVPHLLIALYRKNTEQSIEFIEKALEESQKKWDMGTSPLYYRYPQKSFEKIGTNFMKSFISEIKNNPEYEFLKGNKNLTQLLAKYEELLES